jgi:recombination protein RecA
MPRTKKEIVETNHEVASIEDAMSIIDEMNPEASYLSENALSNVRDWIDTGSMALNAIISGSLHKGVPMGRITGFAGPSGCGKTLILNKIAANAQRKGIHVIYFDTESALDNETAERLGCDTSKLKHCPIEIIEDCRNQIVKFLKNVVEKKMEGRFLIIIDSLGNLISSREAKVIEDQKDSADMGSKAVAYKSMLRAITHAAAKANCAVLFSNHTYDNPGALYPTLVKSQAGGSGPLYMSSVLVQMSTKQEKASKLDNKNAKEESTAISKDINGMTLRCVTTKNRFVAPFLETELYLNFKTGLAKYSGLLEMAEAYGILEKQGHRYAFNGENIGFYKEFRDNDDIWSKIIIPLDQELQVKLAFNKENAS